MDTQIHWMVELKIKPEQDKELRILIKEMVDAVYKNENGALDYEYHVSGDGKVCHLFERYADAAATITHLNNFAAVFAKRFSEVFQPIRFVVYGTPNADVRQALSGFNALYMEPIGGFMTIDVTDLSYFFLAFSYSQEVDYDHFSRAVCLACEEHLLPLFVAPGAGGEQTIGTQLHTSFTYGVFSMAAYAFTQ